MSGQIKVCMIPRPSEAAADTSNAINQIVLRLQQALPVYGVELVDDPNQADLIAGHAGQTGGVTRVDVAHCHGLYPTAELVDAPGWFWGANHVVIESLIRAKAITVPSEWVADILRRDMHVGPNVVGWAVDPSEWVVGPGEGYVLWNKTRADGVCTPGPMLALARKAPAQSFVSTYGEGPNIRTVGRQSFGDMKQLIQGASVYLATTLETFGIGTLEAMACGVPILGFRWGGTADIVEHGVTGYLVEPTDIDGLKEGLEYCLRHRTVLGQNARKVALTYTWDKVAKAFAAIYQRVIQPHKGSKVSVVIPCHNYAQYVGQAIDSVKAQTLHPEIVVVLDRCTDDSATVVRNRLGSEDKCVETDFGNPADARNRGIELSSGEYICCLDADDAIGDTRFLQTLNDALDNGRALGVAFTGLRVMDTDGNIGGQTNWPDGYNFDQQVARHNQVPTCCLFRREAWRRAGGYRAKYVPAEDAELWLRMGSLGYRGQQVTAEPWFLYRMHDNSLSTDVRTGKKPEPDWIGDKPWIKDGKRPFASDGRPPMQSWPVRNYNKPVVTIVVPCAEHHRRLLPDALDSIEAQTFRDWECIVVNDSDKPLQLRGFPWVIVVDTGGVRNAGAARNLGVREARTPLIAFLDADDVLSPRFLDLTLRQYARTGRYVYTDWVSLNKEGIQEPHPTDDYDPNLVFKKTSLHSINILISREDFFKVGGFDEHMPAWEDVDFFMKLAAKGICGVRVPELLVLYRYTTGALRETGETVKKQLISTLRSRYLDYIEGRAMCSCSQPKKPQVNAEVAPPSNGHGEMVRIEYHGPTGQHAVIGSLTQQNYGRRANGDTFYIYLEDQRDTPDRFVPIAEVIAASTATPVPPEPVAI